MLLYNYTKEKEKTKYERMLHRITSKDKYERERRILQNCEKLQKKNCKYTKDKSITIQKSFCKAFDKSNVRFGNPEAIGIEDMY